MFGERKRGRTENHIAMLMLVFLAVALAVVFLSNTAFGAEIRIISSEPGFSNVEIVQVSDPHLIIKVTFDKPAVDYDARLYDEESNQISLILLNITDEGKVFRFQPEKQLDEKVYKFLIQAKDSLGNVGELKEYNFKVNITTINITLENPRYGAASTHVFDLRIRTNRNAVLCKYYSYGTHTFEEAGLPGFINETSRLHAVYNFTNTETAGLPINIICNDTYGKINNNEPARFLLFYDPTPPEIKSFTATPFFVIEENQVSLRVETDDETICRFDKEQVPFSSMAGSFPNYNAHSFSKVNIYDLPLKPEDDQKKSTYYAACMNRAENISETASVSFEVNRTTADTILSVIPSGETSNTSITFEASTNKDASCIVFVGGAQLSLLADNKRVHYSAAQQFFEGIYPYSVNCTFDISGRKKARAEQFVIDTTPPVVLLVNDTNPDSRNACCSCINNLFAKWTANETLSRISKYAYRIVEKDSNAVVVNWTFTTENSVQLSGLNLSENKVYVFEVVAYNSVGLNSAVARSDGVTAKLEYCLSNVTCNDNIIDGAESDVDCGGSCPKKCAEGNSCNQNSDCITNLCDLSIRKCVKPLCQNGKLDAEESDVDCGGSCPKCDEGKICTQSEDCKSDVCSDGFCQAPSCSDGVKNGDETDVDCGGSCPKCELNLACLVDADCSSSSCEYKKCVEATCEDGKKDGDETDVDCGGSCSTKCELSQLCVIDADCSSVYCNEQIKKCDDYKKKDSDKDGIPDWWEKLYFGSETCVDPMYCGPDADPDKDGYTNFEEYQNGTNPLKKDRNPAAMWIFIISIVVIIVAGAAVYFFVFRKAAKNGILPSQAERKPGEPKEFFAGSAEQAYEKPISRKEFREKMMKKQKERLKVFEAFKETEKPEVKKEEIRKPIAPAERNEAKPVPKEKTPAKEVEEFKMRKKEKEHKRSIPKEDVFKKLPKKKNVFDELEKLRKPKL